MTKVTRPLFSDSAHGPLGTHGSFRRGRHGPEFIAQGQNSGGNTSAQTQRRACFRAAKIAHSAIIPTHWSNGDRSGYHRVPAWPDFWRQWLIDHPECTP